MSSKPEHLNSDREHHHNHNHHHHNHQQHHLQSHHYSASSPSPSPQHQQLLHHHQHHPQQQPHHQLSSLPVPALASSSPSVGPPTSSAPSPSARFGAPLPALHDHSPRYNPTTTSAYESVSVTSGGASSAYGSYGNGYQPASYPTSSSSFSYSLTSSESSARIPSIHSPKSVMAPHNRSTSGGTKSVSPSLGSSVRSEYTTTTPGIQRHLPTRPSQAELLASPHSPMSPGSAVSPTMGGLTSPAQATSNGLGGTNAGPPLDETALIHHLTSADGHMVRPEIHARVDKGFFLSERDWTCYRRNYFSVICSYSLMPSTYSLPLYLRRTPNSAPEHILAFAMCISAVVDAPGGKTVELVQHTPKRDKGPQHKPAKIKLSPQPAGGMSFAGSAATPVIQQSHPPQPGMEHEYSFPQQSQQQPPQHIAVFDRIQFKSATANNGKRRAAQQYYHLIVELYADVGSSGPSAPGQPSSPGNDGGWVKIAHRISAPMVVRGRSPGHYADGQRASSTSSPGGGSTGGNQSSGPHPPPHTSGGPGFMGSDGLSSSNAGGQSQGMHHQHVSSPPTSSAHNPASTHGGSPASQYSQHPAIDPELDAETQPPITGTYPAPPYTFIATTLYEPAHLPPSVVDSGYAQTQSSYGGDRKSEQPIETSCPQFENDIPAYIPTTMASGDTYRKALVKDEYSPASSVPWLGSGAQVGREQRLNQHNLFSKCGRLETAESSRHLFPDISPIN